MIGDRHPLDLVAAVGVAIVASTLLFLGLALMFVLVRRAWIDSPVNVALVAIVTWGVLGAFWLWLRYGER